MRERRFQFFPNKLLQVDIPLPAPVSIHKRKVKLPAAATQPVAVSMLFYWATVSVVCRSRNLCRVLRAGAESDTGTRPCGSSRAGENINNLHGQCSFGIISIIELKQTWLGSVECFVCQVATINPSPEI